MITIFIQLRKFFQWIDDTNTFDFDGIVDHAHDVNLAIFFHQRNRFGVCHVQSEWLENISFFDGSRLVILLMANFLCFFSNNITNWGTDRRVIGLYMVYTSVRT